MQPLNENNETVTGRARPFIRLTTGEFEPWTPESVNLTRDDYRDRCAMLQRDLRTEQRWATGYRRLALLGWLAFLGALLWQPSAHADTLPAGSIACVDAAAWAEQENATIFELAPGCVYTYHDFEVSVEAPGVVWVEFGEKRQKVWVFAAAVQPEVSINRKGLK